MISDPFLCIRGQKVGTIEWFHDAESQKKSDGLIYDSCIGPMQNVWQEYAEFERGKLGELECFPHEITPSSGGYELHVPKIKKGYKVKTTTEYLSCNLIGYGLTKFTNDSESSRLLKRAEFLRAVCKKEGALWIEELPKMKCEHEGYVNVKGECINCCKEFKKGEAIFSRSHTPASEPYFTKSEIDERLSTLCDLLDAELSLIPKPPRGKKNLGGLGMRSVLEFRKIFLPDSKC